MNIWTCTTQTGARVRVPAAAQSTAVLGGSSRADTGVVPPCATIGTGGRVFGLCGVTRPVREVRAVSGGLSWGGPDDE